MKLQHVAEALKLKSAFEGNLEGEVTGAYTSDLLSDVMANGLEGQALITIQAHKNTVAVATLIGASAIIICNNRPLTPDFVEAAREEQVPLFVTEENQFTLSGKLYALLGA